MFVRRFPSAFGLALIAASFLPLPTAAAGVYQRYYFDQPIQMTLNLMYVAVYQDPDAQPPPPPLGPILVTHGIDPLSAHELGASGWTVVGAPPGIADAAAMEQLVAALAAEPGLQSASPVFHDGAEGFQIVLTDILVRFDEKTLPAVQQQILNAAGVGVVLDEDWGGMANAWRLRSASQDGFETLDAANGLAVNPDVRWAEPDLMMTWYPDELPEDFYFDLQWSALNYGQIVSTSYSDCCSRTTGDVHDIDMDTAEAWTISTGDPDVRIAVLDDGADINHADLNIDSGVDIADHYPSSGGTGAHGDPCDRHGTAVAGVIAGIHNTVGVAGVAPDCTTVPVRIALAGGLNICDWSTSSGRIVVGLQWAYNDGCTITNNSYHMGTPSSSVADAFTVTHAAGMLHFASTGNQCDTSVAFPASDVDVNAVGAIDPDGAISCFSNTGGGVAFVAPGTYIWTTDRTGSLGYTSADYDDLNGTSFSSPAAAGVAGLIWSVGPSLTADEVKQVMVDTAVDLGSAGHDSTFGYGLVNAHRALLDALGWLDADRSFIISEIRTYDPATPDEEEYVEIYNTSASAEPLNQVSYAVIGDDAADSDGVIDEFFDLSPIYETLDGHDFWTVATSTFTLGTADQTTALQFENGDNVTHMLLLYSSMTPGCDLDLDDDGVLDYTPWLKIIDSVAILDESGSAPSTSEWWYADDTIGPNGVGDAPGHVYRCGTVGAWEIGPADPAIGDDTPDDYNGPCGDFIWGGMSNELIEAFGESLPGGLLVTGGAGNNGFGVIAHGPFSDFMCFETGDFHPGAMPDGATIDGTARGVIDGVPGQVIAQMHAAIIAGQMQLMAAFPNASSSLQDVTLLDDGATVADLPGLNQPVIIIGGPILEPPILEFAPKPVDPSAPLQAGGTVTFGQDVMVTTLGPQGPLTADQVVFRPSTTLPYDHMNAVDLIAADTPSFTIGGELVGKFGHAHRALGAARFLIGPNAIAVEQLNDPQGGDGIAVELPEPVTGFMTQLAPLPAPPEGAFLDWTTCHVDALGDPAFCATSRVLRVGASLVLSFESAPWGTALVQVYLAGELQAQAEVSTVATLATVLGDPEWPTELGLYQVPELIYTWSGFAPTTIGIGGGPTVEGDEIRVTDAGMAAGGGTLMSSMALTGAQIGQITIIDEQSAAPTPCPGDIDGDGTVGINDFLAVLAAWGPCPGCPEDIDGDGTVGINDFLDLLAAWGECP